MCLNTYNLKLHKVHVLEWVKYFLTALLKYFHDFVLVFAISSHLHVSDHQPSLNVLGKDKLLREKSYPNLPSNWS